MKKWSRMNRERDLVAVRMRQQGMKFREIAEALGWDTPQAAMAAVKRAALDVERESRNPTRSS